MPLVPAWLFETLATLSQKQSGMQAGSEASEELLPDDAMANKILSARGPAPHEMSSADVSQYRARFWKSWQMTTEERRV